MKRLERYDCAWWCDCKRTFSHTFFLRWGLAVLFDTVAFVRAHTAPCRLLEVGCGSGAVAARLQELGFEVTAIDEDEDVVAEARARGVNALAARWPRWQPPAVDTVLFTRSLHHIPDTSAAAARAAAVAPLVLVEDFAYEECAPALIAWFASEAGKLRLPPDTFAARLARAADTHGFWRAQHEHDLATAREMEDAMRAHCATVKVTGAPYLYRYLGDADPETIARVAEGELEFARRSGIRPLGLRIVGRSTARPSPA